MFFNSLLQEQKALNNVNIKLVFSSGESCQRPRRELALQGSSAASFSLTLDTRFDSVLFINDLIIRHDSLKKCVMTSACVKYNEIGKIIAV